MNKAEFNRMLRTRLTPFTERVFQTVGGNQTYKPNWHIDLITDRLMGCLRGDIRRLIICMPPRSLKSITASVAFPAFILGRDPAARVICASYSSDLASKHGRDCRAVMESSWYRQVFPRTSIRGQKNTEDELVTSAGGGRLNTSVGGTLTGQGGNYLIIDDPMKPQEAQSQAQRDHVYDWFTGTALSRLDDKSSDVIIVVMQRLHEDDLAGRLIANGRWDLLQLPAIAEEDETFAFSNGRVHHRYKGDVLHPSRETVEGLETLPTMMGSFVFSAQYQQKPVPTLGNMVKPDWIRRYDKAPEPQAEDLIVQSWDTSQKATQLNDYSVCTTWLIRNNDLYLLDLFRDRLEYPALKKKAIEMIVRYRNPMVLVEDKGSGTSLIQDLRHEGYLPRNRRPESVSKPACRRHRH